MSPCAGPRCGGGGNAGPWKRRAWRDATAWKAAWHAMRAVASPSGRAVTWGASCRCALGRGGKLIFDCSGLLLRSLCVAEGNLQGVLLTLCMEYVQG